MDVSTGYGRIRIRDAKRVSISIHRSKTKIGKIKHFHSGNDLDEFYTQDIEFKNGKDETVNITLFADKLYSLLDPKKEVIDVERRYYESTDEKN